MGTHPKQSETEYDTIVIGSSPLVLLEALYRERLGKRVAIFEKRDRLGGAWYTMPMWEFTATQPGCHYIERLSTGYEFLLSYLGIELAEQRFKAVWYNSGPKPTLARPAKWLVHHALSGRMLSDDVWGMIKSIGRKDPGKFGRAFKRMLTSPAYRYPAGGTHAMIDALEKRIDASSITLFKNTRVENVELESETGGVRCSVDGRVYQAGELVVGRHVYPRLCINGVEPGAFTLGYAINIVLRIKGGKATPFDYLELHRNDLINRVHDITDFTEPAVPDGELLVCCNLTEVGGGETAVDDAAVFEHLVEIGLIAQGSTLLASHTERYPNPETAAGEASGPIHIVNTYDLGVGLGRGAERWRVLLDK